MPSTIISRSNPRHQTPHLPVFRRRAVSDKH
jgi:hypothetical protein